MATPSLGSGAMRSAACRAHVQPALGDGRTAGRAADHDGGEDGADAFVEREQQVAVRRLACNMARRPNAPWSATKRHCAAGRPLPLPADSAAFAGRERDLDALAPLVHGARGTRSVSVKRGALRVT